MSTVGPDLPPHLQSKRKRTDDADEDVSHTPSKRARSSSREHDPQPRRIIGPAPPPAPLSERPTTAPKSYPEDSSSNSEDSDSDDFGPSLPPAPGTSTHKTEILRQQKLSEDISALSAAQKPAREEWMLVPPKQDDWTTRVDPTKLRNRKFNTGKGSKAPSSQGGTGGNENALWTETPEQKRQRLEDEVMGVRKPAQLGGGLEDKKRDERKEREARETQEKIRAYDERNRGESLYREHHKKAGPKEKEDDPSARVFDREKDMGLGVKVGHAQKREMLTKARDFGSRFAGGNYL